MLGPDRPLAPVERLDALDPEHVRLDPVDPSAQRDEEAAEILHVRLAGRVADHGLVAGQDGRHDRVLSAHHARLVEEELRPREPAGAELSRAQDRELDGPARVPEDGSACAGKMDEAPPRGRLCG